MAIPLLLARRGWKLLRSARAVLQTWRQLPPTRRAELHAAMQRIGTLSVELAAGLAAQQRRSTPARSLAAVMADLSAELDRARQAAPELATSFTPRTRRGRVASRAVSGVGGVALRRAQRRRAGTAAPTLEEEPGDERELAALEAELTALRPDP